jgi:hypothetical protein
LAEIAVIVGKNWMGPLAIAAVSALAAAAATYLLVG